MSGAYLLKSESFGIEKFPLKSKKFKDLRVSHFEPKCTRKSFYMHVVADTKDDRGIFLLMDESNDLPQETYPLTINKTLEKLTNGKLLCLGNILLVYIRDIGYSEAEVFVEKDIPVEELFKMIEIRVYGLGSNKKLDVFDARAPGRGSAGFRFQIPDCVGDACDEEEEIIEKKYIKFFAGFGMVI